MNNINCFTFYRNYYEIIKYLNPKDKLQLLEAILDYMFEDKEPELKQFLNGDSYSLIAEKNNITSKQVDNMLQAIKKKLRTIADDAR